MWKMLIILAIPGADLGWILKFFVVNASMVLSIVMTAGGVFLPNIGTSVPDYLLSCC